MLMVVPSRSMNLDPGTKPLATTGSAQRAAGRPRFPKPEGRQAARVAQDKATHAQEIAVLKNRGV